MELKYYSCYPYEADDYKVVPRIPKKGDSDFSQFAWDMPFRLYLAAYCSDHYEDERLDYPEQFIGRCFDAMDRPDVRIKGYRDGHKYIDKNNNIEVTPTKHFYGATNNRDGVYVIDEHCYFVIYDGCPQKFQSWCAALDCVAERYNRGYLKGIDYKPVENL